MSDTGEYGQPTEGPWEAYFNVHGDPFVVPSAHPYLTHRICDVSKAPADYGRANALLLAAAPDLLAALIEARAEVDRWGYGDFHYGETPRDPGVLAMLARIDAVLATVPQSGRDARG